MSEHTPYPEIPLANNESVHDALSTYELHYKTLREWVDWLSEDPGKVPCSRYGRNSEECAPWAVALEIIYLEGSGENHDEPELNLQHAMGLVVNDHDEPLELVRDYWWCLPKELKPFLEYEEQGLSMAQWVALKSLCSRYDVEFDPEHYKPAYDLPDGYVSGWVGGQRHANPQYAKPDEPAGKPTLYVGVSLEGEVSS